MDQKWFEDIMSQKYHEDICFNPSKIILLEFICKEGTIEEKYKIADFQEYMYRIYADNPDISQKHPSYLIRNISSYGIKDLLELANDTLESWCRDAVNNILKKGEKYFFLQVDYLDGEDIAKNTFRLCKMLYKKVFKGNIPEIKDTSLLIAESDDMDLNSFGLGPYKNRVLEDFQYCPICEEIDTHKLYCVHIVNRGMCAPYEDLVDKANGLLFCKEHAEAFNKNEFYFDEMGFAHNSSKSLIEKGMHLSFTIRSSKRKKFLKKRYEYLKEKGILVTNDDEL